MGLGETPLSNLEFSEIFRFCYRKAFGRTWRRNQDGPFTIMLQEIQLYYACCLIKLTVPKLNTVYISAKETMIFALNLFSSRETLRGIMSQRIRTQHDSM